MADDNEEIKENEDGAEGEEAEGGKKKPGLIKLALFIGLPVVILLLGGTAAFLLLSGGGEEAQLAEAGDHGEAGDGLRTGVHNNAHFVELPEIIFSITDRDGRAYTVSLKLAFETADENFEESFIEAEKLQIRDQFMGFLSALRPSDIEGSAGIQRLRMELLRRAQLVLGHDRISAVLITELVRA